MFIFQLDSPFKLILSKAPSFKAAETSSRIKMSLKETLALYNLSYYASTSELVSESIIQRENDINQLVARWFDLFMYFPYWFLGGFIFISNMLILLSVTRHSALRVRKECA